MLPFEDRHSRQRRLPEVGPAGQLRIAQSRVVLAAHPGGAVEREYLVRAGVGQLEDDPCAPPPVFPWADEFEFAAASTVACGAWCALHRLRNLLFDGDR